MIGKKRVAILGGAFDPIHCDHLKLGQICLDKELVDEVWFTPSPSVRWDKQTQLSAEKRMEILRASIESNPKFYPCSLEVEWGEFRGAYVFFQRLQTLYPQVEFHLLMGADTYHGILDWRDPQSKHKTNGLSLLQEIPLILFSRQGFDFPDEEQHRQLGGLPWQSFEVDDEIGECSSTMIRENLKSGQSIQEWVHPNALKLVKEYYSQLDCR